MRRRQGSGTAPASDHPVSRDLAASARILAPSRLEARILSPDHLFSSPPLRFRQSTDFLQNPATSRSIATKRKRIAGSRHLVAFYF